MTVQPHLLGWIYTGSWTEQGNQMANRDNSDPSGLGNTLGWAWAWPLNRRVLYNRASADINGKTVGSETDADPVERQQVDG
ncbi:formate dehydrogenase, nitrate-inducible, major subunit [Escherichia coli]|uniref:Formate dehydrogenase, nitrate-inducible, major subunit n=1 Tax=Escherichia coli TaxID=562 RepID=A0A376ZZQ4_ECOLX|nr:formate dehydrogenase, nitrate-inducible, major subunit [Escherichia coli]